ncbi:glycosyltransferase [Halovivax asiaticus JCM 14624]|uniref:Glycosyltransferase n=1 Tax=Halovivax asiaticus JCM 14624 TaxID=1227490 RepID=M0BW58_9EURY|nr:glucosyl-dolichyl phosphate glucuronosyltransferase [Halovivax asiaticus]ELZ13889.1 glycosyltransferase [Halovivax asiaticus JCM 14624]
MEVSVVVCTYSLDMYDHFCDAADSVLTQSYDDIELVIVVDGTEAVFDRVQDDYADRDDTVIHCNEENQGLLRSRNRGAELATGDVVAFLDDDAVADSEWVGNLVAAYEEEDATAVGGKMTPIWVAGNPTFLPAEFYWLVGVTHAGFADGACEVRNTFGSNISFRHDVFTELGGFDPDIGGRKGDANLQGGETELCARMNRQYGSGVWYVPSAEVGHKVFDYRTDFRWLLDRAFWQGYSKRAMSVLLPKTGDEEGDFLRYLLVESVPSRLRGMVWGERRRHGLQLISLLVFTVVVGLGYLYGLIHWR